MAGGGVRSVAGEGDGTVAVVGGSGAGEGEGGELAAGDEGREAGTKAPVAPTCEEAVARVAEAMAAFPPSSNGAAFARAALERWSGVDES